MEKQKQKLQEKKMIQSKNGITLIALIITIILLLILAGISIQQLGENGIFAKVKSTKLEHMKAEAKENIILAIMQIQTDEAKQGITTTLETLSQKLTPTDSRIQVNEYTAGDTELTGVYTANSKTSFNYIIESNFNVIIGELLDPSAAPFGITVSNIGLDRLTVTADRGLEDYSKFTYVAEPTTGSEIRNENITATTYEITGLQPGTVYKVYMIAFDNDGNDRKSQEKIVTTDVVPAAITFTTATWSGGKASIEINTSESTYKIQYQINDTTEGQWITSGTAGASVTVNNLNSGDTVYARLTDGTYSGEYANEDIVDSIKPTGSITLEKDTVKPTEEIKATVTMQDNESGITATNCKWVITNSATAVGENLENYTGGNLDSDGKLEGTSSNSEDSDYVHVLLIDNAQNKLELVAEVKKSARDPLITPNVMTTAIYNDGVYKTGNYSITYSKRNGLTHYYKTNNSSDWIQVEGDEVSVPYGGSYKYPQSIEAKSLNAEGVEVGYSNYACILDNSFTPDSSNSWAASKCVYFNNQDAASWSECVLDDSMKGHNLKVSCFANRCGSGNLDYFCFLVCFYDESGNLVDTYDFSDITWTYNSKYGTYQTRRYSVVN